MRKDNIARNPYLPSKVYIPDGEPKIFGERLYVFGSHDEFGSDRYCTGSYLGWSAPLSDLGSWRNEGVILEKGLDPLDPEADKDYYAPDVVQGPDNRYYLYYSIEGSHVISVAVCEEPAGNYQFLGHVKDSNGHVIGSSEGDYFQFDPAVLVDDDGKIYLYSGQGLPIDEVQGRKIGGSLVCELHTDMITTKTDQKVLSSHTEKQFDENLFFEASSIRKFDGIYYFIYSPLPNTHLLCYATSKYPDRDFTYQGILVSNADIFIDENPEQTPFYYWGNNHGSLIKILDDYFVFYHRSTNKSPNTRQAMADRIYKDAKGKFVQARMTSNGLNNKPFLGRGRHLAYTAWQLQKKEVRSFIPYEFLKYDEMDPYITQEDGTETPYIANLTDGTKCGFRYYNFDGMEEEISITTRGQGKGKVSIFSDENIFSEIEIEPNKSWVKNDAPFRAPCNKQSIVMTFEGTGAIDILSFEIK